ncbi:hypothetical protein ACIPSE_28825 [Streptomyces sp. NPDC090106]|uniref:hypothetical protein n=1 Tax=Streptomyces sp. NPDC090106 TaxID=3365946 RepID=UPI0037FA2E0B
MWVTGRSVADRLATAHALAERLLAERRRVEVLDRFADIGADARRTGLVAEVPARNGVVAIVPCAQGDADAVRERHAASGTRYVEVCADSRTCATDQAAKAHGMLAGHG